MKDARTLLEDLRLRVLKELDSPLKKNARNLVFGKGDPDARIFFIGEAPGEQEDIQGVPFVGRAGKELDKLLGIIGLKINDVYIANILKYRPPNNRDPKYEEILEHTPFLIEQINIINPDVIVTLGNFATKFVLGGLSVDGMKKIPGISAIHGLVKNTIINGREVAIIPMYHPAAMLYKPQLRAVVEKDFLNLGSFLSIKYKGLKDYL